MPNPTPARGTIAIRPDDTDWVPQALRRANSPGARGVTSALYVWTPPPEMRQELPEDFTLKMRCATFPDGVRRFYPEASFSAFVSQAFAGGLAVGSHLLGWPSDALDDSRRMYLFFRWVRRASEHFRNQLVNNTSLRVSLRGRAAGEGQTTILPEVGAPDSPGEKASKKGQGARKPRRPSLGPLLRAGREAARAFGIERPTERDLIAWGLAEFASRDPLRVDKGRVPGLVRAALFGRACGTKEMPEGVRDLVLKRFWRAVGPVLKDTRPGKFDEWFLGRGSNLLSLLSRPTRDDPTPIDRKAVRQALLDLGWEAYPYVANAIDAMMRLFRGLLPVPLTGAERACYAQTYLKQPHFGHLPLVLLVERFAFLEPLVWRIWEDPEDQEAVCALHRVLYYYEQMAPRRRAVDRAMKQHAAGSSRTGRRSLEVAMPENLDPEAAPTASPDDDCRQNASLEGIAATARRKNHIICRCPSGEAEWHDWFIGEKAGTFSFGHECRTCRKTTRSRLTKAQCAELRAELGGH
jgi:hypothetical protein